MTEIEKQKSAEISSEAVWAQPPPQANAWPRIQPSVCLKARLEMIGFGAPHITN